MLAAEWYDVMLLPVVLGSAVTLFKCPDRAIEEMDIPMPETRDYKASSIYLAYTGYKPCVPTTTPEKANANLRSKGKDKWQIVSLPTPICPQGASR
jgi:hypothetical protein